MSYQCLWQYAKSHNLNCTGFKSSGNSRKDTIISVFTVPVKLKNSAVLGQDKGGKWLSVRTVDMHSSQQDHFPAHLPEQVPWRPCGKAAGGCNPSPPTGDSDVPDEDRPVQLLLMVLPPQDSTCSPPTRQEFPRCDADFKSAIWTLRVVDRAC